MLAGVAQAATPPLSPTSEKAEKQLKDKLTALFNTPAARSGTALTGKTINDLSPTIITEAAALKTTAGTALSGFQKSTLDAVPLILAHPQTLQAGLSGQKLTNDQRRQMESDQDALSRNPAFRRMIDYVSPLAFPSGTAKLTADVQAYIANEQASQAGPHFQPSPSGDVNLDKITAGLHALSSNANAQTTSAALLPLLQDPAFVSLLQDMGKKNPAILLQFVPNSELAGLLLPNDHDPPLTPLQEYQTEFSIELAAWAAVIIGVFLSGALATTAGALGSIALLGLGGYAFYQKVTLMNNTLAKAQDCDAGVDPNDPPGGDPGDPNDAPGNECP